MKSLTKKLAIGAAALGTMFGSAKAGIYDLPIAPETVVDDTRDWRDDIPGKQNKVSFRFNIGSLPFHMTGVNAINLKMNLEENGFYGPFEAPEGSVYGHLKDNSRIEDCYGIVMNEEGWVQIAGYMDDKAMVRDSNGDFIAYPQRAILSDYANWTLTGADVLIPEYNGRKMKKVKSK